MARPLADHLTLMDTAHRCGRSPGCRLSAREKTKQASQLQRLLIEDIRHAQGDWIDLAAVLADTEKMTEDLLVSSRLLVPLVFRNRKGSSVLGFGKSVLAFFKDAFAFFMIVPSADMRFFAAFQVFVGGKEMRDFLECVLRYVFNGGNMVHAGIICRDR